MNSERLLARLDDMRHEIAEAALRGSQMDKLRCVAAMATEVGYAAVELARDYRKLEARLQALERALTVRRAA